MCSCSMPALQEEESIHFYYFLLCVYNYIFQVVDALEFSQHNNNLLPFLQI